MKPMLNAGNISMYCLLLVTIFWVTTSIYEPMTRELLTLSHRAEVKLQLSRLKISLLSYNADLRQMPFAGRDPAKADAYTAVWRLMIVDEPGINILNNARVSTNPDGWENMGMSVKNYAIRWHGPYLDQSGKQAFTDRWGNQITYYGLEEGKFLRIFLHSAGEDGEYDLGHPKLASLANDLSASRKSNWSNIFNLSARTMLNAHQSSYNGDDLLLEIIRIPLNRLKS